MLQCSAGKCKLTHLYRSIPLLKRLNCHLPEWFEMIVIIGTVKKLAIDQSPMARRDVGRAGVGAAGRAKRGWNQSLSVCLLGKSSAMSFIEKLMECIDLGV